MVNAGNLPNDIPMLWSLAQHAVIKQDHELLFVVARKLRILISNQKKDIYE